MAVYPPKIFSRISRAFPFFILFCCALAVLLSAVYVQASTEIPGTTDKICLVPPLSNAIAHYKQIAARGGWPQVPAGPTLRAGDRNERITLLKQRLLVSADLSAPVGEEDFFDEKLTEAVRRFQARHGLTADGRVGVNTLRELNVPVGKRIEQLSVNIERCSAMPYPPEQRFILVNIADFTLKLFENGNLQLAMSVIVGKKYRQTQEFTGRISSLVLNPNWNVPRSIAVKDLLPKIKNNPGYLKRMRIRVLRDGKDVAAIDPATIDWGNLSAAHFPYRLQQDPGPGNALGRIKFVFPNPYDLYLHDTPAQELFKKDTRTFSSGCIRLSKPLELAVYLLQGTSLSTMESLTARMSNKKTQWINIPSPIAIYIVYMTAWVDPGGIINFRSDIYNRDTASRRPR